MKAVVVAAVPRVVADAESTLEGSFCAATTLRWNTKTAPKTALYILLYVFEFENDIAPYMAIIKG